MRIVYKGTRSGKTRVAIITYSDNEKNVAFDIAHEIEIATPYKVDMGVYGMLIIDVDDFNDYNNFKELYKEFKHVLNKTAEQSEAEQAEAEQIAEQPEAEQAEAEQTETKTDKTTTKQTGYNKKYIVRAFENDKELTVQCPYFPKREYAIDYINNLYENGVVSRDVVFTINNSDIYNCFSDVKLEGTTAHIKIATDILNEFYKQLCSDIAFEYKMRIYDDIDIESKDYYAHLNIFITTLKKVLNENNARDVIKNRDKFEICGNVYRTAIAFILAYNENKSDWLIKYLENKIRRELKLLQ